MPDGYGIRQPADPIEMAFMAMMTEVECLADPHGWDQPHLLLPSRASTQAGLIELDSQSGPS